MYVDRGRKSNQFGVDSGVLVEPVTNRCCSVGLLRVDVQQNSSYPAAGYRDRFGPSAKHFLTVTVLECV